MHFKALSILHIQFYLVVYSMDFFRSITVNEANINKIDEEKKKRTFDYAMKNERYS